MEFRFSKKSLILITTLFLLSVITLLTISISSDIFISNNDENSDFSLKSDISNIYKPTLRTTDINGNLIDDFKPGENVYVHGSNFSPNSYIEINLTRPDGLIESAPFGRFESDVLPLTKKNGDFNFYEYDLNGIEGEYLIQATDGENYAQLIFNDSTIWTTDGLAQQKNRFISGEPVGIDGEGLTHNAHLYYEIKDEPGGGNNVSWGWVDTDPNGEIIFTIIWEIPISYSNVGQHKIYVYDTQAKSKTFSISLTDLIDNDNDGYYALPQGTDCNDNDPYTYPGAPELCDGKDNDCDGTITDEEIDEDEDNYTPCEGDCDDTDSNINPDATEICDDGIDNNCDGLIDDDCPVDNDEDGYYAPPHGEDCDDNDPYTYPGAPELCDGIDNDCDSIIPSDEINDDSDTYSECEGDCNDNDPYTYPGAPELCDGKDNDCDGTITDEEIDEDEDNYTPCEGDCDDTDSNINPDATEICDDGIDNNCDGLIDDDCPVDNDEDGYYAPPHGEDCDDNDPYTYPGAPELCDGIDNDCDSIIPSDEINDDSDTYSECEGDCNDNDPYTYPGAPELCDGKDNDCDGTITDEEIDEDEDNYTPCEGDCDDTDPNTYPGAPELLDGKDNDCDGEIENNFSPQFGNPTPSDRSSNNPLSFDWSIQINDTETGVFDWNISCSNGQYSYSFESLNGTKTLHLSGLSYSTTYTVWVKVFDYSSWNNKSYKFTTKGKSVDSNIPPVAIIDGLLIGFPGESIDFSGSKSYDPDGDISTYTWDLDDGTVLNGENITHVYSNPGGYNVTLTVFDNIGAKNSTISNVIIIKGNNPPELNISIYNSPGNLTVNLTITVIDRDGDNVSCIIDWDDDNLPTILELSSNQSVNENHNYYSYNTYEIFVSANDGSTITSESRLITLSEGNKKEDKNNTNGKGNKTSNILLDIIENNEPFDEAFMDNKIDSRSILGDNPDKSYAKIIATILSIILLFLLNYLIEFFSDYFSEKTIDYRKNWKSRFAPKTAMVSAAGMFLSIKEIVAIIASTVILSFVLTWTWVPDLSMFLETFVVFLLIVIVIIFIREALRGFLCSKFNFHSQFYIWPLGAIMMFVSTAIGNTFSLAANHHYDKGDIKKCGKVSFIVSFVIYVILAIAFLINLYYPSTILQMIIIVSVLNLFIDMFPLKPMDGYEVRHWNKYLWLCFYIIIIISYIIVYFNLYP